MIKTPNVAGAFYPTDKATIMKMLDSFFDNVKIDKETKDLNAIVAPHAGYIYSGQVAAYSYKALQEYFKFQMPNSHFQIPTFIILAPSHYEYFE